MIVNVVSSIASIGTPDTTQFVEFSVTPSGSSGANSQFVNSFTIGSINTELYFASTEYELVVYRMLVGTPTAQTIGWISLRRSTFTSESVICSRYDWKRPELKNPKNRFDDVSLYWASVILNMLDQASSPSAFPSHVNSVGKAILYPG